MKDILKKLKSLQPSHVTTLAVTLLERHTPTVLILFAGVLIGFSLYAVNDLTSDVSSEMTTGGETAEAAPNTIALDKQVEAALIALQGDTDVEISSNIASYRRSAFSDVTAESDWVIEAASLLESFKASAGSYPTKENLINALTSQDSSFEVIDEAGLVVNEQGGSYSYEAEKCDNEECQGFLLTARLGSNIYQLGETDALKRTWVNDTAQALDVYRKFEDRGYYPLEANFASEMTNFYKTVLQKEFASADPSGKKINEDGSAFFYRGINCDKVGCDAFVLRTTFKDDASYFQQSK